MRTNRYLAWLTTAIGALALVAASAGLFWPSDGEPFTFTSHRGEQVLINGRGLYQFDTVSAAAQEQAADVVTLLIGLPLLAVSAWLARRGSLRGQLLLTGTLGYFLYTYTQMSVNSSYNPLFLVYVAVMALSLYAFVLSMLDIDLASLPQRFSERMPRRAIAGVLFAVGAFLLLAWLGRILPTLNSRTAPLDNMTTMVIQAMDLGLLLPLTFVSGIQLLRRSAWGYLLAAVAVLKMLTLGASVSAMAIHMALANVAISPMELVVFPALTLVNLITAALLLSHVKEAADRSAVGAKTSWEAKPGPADSHAAT